MLSLFQAGLNFRHLVLCVDRFPTLNLRLQTVKAQTITQQHVEVMRL